MKMSPFLGTSKLNSDREGTWWRNGGEILTGSPGSFPPRMRNPNPVSFRHRKISCSWQSGSETYNNKSSVEVKQGADLTPRNVILRHDCCINQYTFS